MKSYNNKKNFLLILTLVALFHLAVINIGSFPVEQGYIGRGGVVHNIYLGYNSGGAGGKANSASSENEEKLTENKNRKKYVRPKSRIVPKKESIEAEKSLEDINLKRRSREDSRAHNLAEDTGFNARGKGGTDGYGHGPPYGGGMSLEQIMRPSVGPRVPL